jgi:hypothetical protein
MDIFPLVVSEAHQARRRPVPRNLNALKELSINYSSLDPHVVFAGGHATPAALFRHLIASGIQMFEFNPIIPVSCTITS